MIKVPYQLGNGNCRQRSLVRAHWSFLLTILISAATGECALLFLATTLNDNLNLMLSLLE